MHIFMKVGKESLSALNDLNQYKLPKNIGFPVIFSKIFSLAMLAGLNSITQL